MLKWYRMVIGLSPSAAAYLKPSVQATWELPKPKSDLFSISAAASTKYRALTRILDLFAEDNRLNVYAGKLEVRPPAAPTTSPSAESQECPVRLT